MKQKTRKEEGKAGYIGRNGTICNQAEESREETPPPFSLSLLPPTKIVKEQIYRFFFSFSLSLSLPC
jgi:hypothetical protein